MISPFIVKKKNCNSLTPISTNITKFNFFIKSFSLKKVTINQLKSHFLQTTHFKPFTGHFLLLINISLLTKNHIFIITIHLDTLFNKIWRFCINRASNYFDGI